MRAESVMAASVTTAHGGPEVIEYHTDWPRPVPGPDEVLVRVTAAAVNNTDLWSRLGAYGTAADPDAVAGWRGVPLDFPLIQGGDIAGVAVEVGEDVPSSWIGRRVIVDPIATYEDGFPAEIVGSEVDGGFAGYHVSAAGRIHDVSGSPLTDEQLACLPIAYGTAMGMVERGACRAGERVLVTGASGGVGLAAVQILVGRGCRVVALTSAGKEDLVARYEPAAIVVRDDLGNTEVPEVDAILDVVGGGDFAWTLDRLRTGGRLVIAGAIAGPVVDIDLRRLYLRNRRLIGSTMHTTDHFAALAELARQGVIEPLVADVFPLAEVPAAQERFTRKDFVGKLVVTPPGP